MIDRIRRELEARLSDLLSEVEKLRKALLALGSADERRESSRSASASKAVRAGTRRARAASSETSARTKATPSRARAGMRTAAPRTAPGATKAAILGALDGAEAMTAAEVATATGISRATISTTLSRLAAAGEITKAARGYTLKSNGNPAEG